MSTAMTRRIAEVSPRLKARIVGVFYLITFVTGVMALVLVNGRLVADLIADAWYIVVTLLFYDIFRPKPTQMQTGCSGPYVAALGRGAAGRYNRPDSEGLMRMPIPARTALFATFPLMAAIILKSGKKSLSRDLSPL